MEASQF